MALTWIRTHDWDAEAWRGRSACRDSDPDVFFPIGTTGPALEQIETARRICTACLVTEECLEFALATNQEAGIWGGTTEEVRDDHGTRVSLRVPLKPAERVELQTI